MSGNYKVDDILAEIERKKSGSSAFAPKSPAGGAARTGPGAPPEGSPFNMRGSNDGSAASPPGAASPFSRQAAPPETTRTDIPTVKTAARPDASARTQVIPAVHSDPEAEFENSRKAKVQQFMQNSFAAESQAARPSPFEEEDGGDLGSLDRYFGGLKRTGAAAGEPPAKEGKKKSGSGPSKGGKGKAKNGAKPKGGKKSLLPAKPQKGGQIKKSSKPAQEDFDDGEYLTPSDARDVREDIFALKRSLNRRVIITGVCCAILLYLSLANLYPIPLLNAICPEVDMKVFLLVNLVVLVSSALAANAVIGNGLVSFFKLKADYDAPTALCTLAVIAHSVALVFNSGSLHTGESGFYFFAASLSLFANSAGKRLMIGRIERNFAVASSDGDLRGEYIVEDGELAARLAQGQGFAEPSVAHSAPIGFPEKFLKLSYSDEYTENLSRYLSHFFLAAALVLAVTCRLFFDSSTMEAFTIFCVVLCVASPLTPTLLGNLPLLRASRALAPERAFISGYDAVEAFEEMNCVVISADELYPKPLVELHGIKPLTESRIDEAILDAVSLSVRIDGLLSEALLGMVGGNRSILLPVDEVRYESAAGVSAMVNGKPVLMGRRSLMEKHNVALPPPEYEKRFTKGGKKVLFIANSGSVTAMLIVSYRPNKKAAEWIGRLARKELGLIVYTMNPNITSKKVSSDFRYPDEFIRILPAELHDEYAALTAYRERGMAYIVSPVKGEARLHALASVHAIRQSIVFGSVMQMAGLIIGYALTAFLAFSGAIASLGFGQLALYQLFWAAATLIISNLKKL